MADNKQSNIEKQIEIIAETAVRIEEWMEKLTTKEELAIGINGLHAEMNEHFDKVNERFNKVDSRLEQINRDIDLMRDRGRLLETRVDKLEIGAR